MPFLRYANAQVVHPAVNKTQWANIRRDGTGFSRTAALTIKDNLIERASEMMQVPFDPAGYLLTHATIIASVDVFSPPDVKTGSVLEEGFRVNRRYADFRIKTEADRYINNNNDAWSRGVLRKAYPTFVGGHNFVEHVQIEELSKGRIIDAVARDIGDSLYVDILIATDKKHADLVKAIQSGRMGTLSMGCTVDGTICTKCGHWAADETEMCPHIKYMKGNSFFDEQGRRHRVAELCGHENLDPTGGVTFIEASWVQTPAFTGAVLRNVLEPTEAQAKQAAQVLSLPPRQWSEDAIQKAASRVTPITETAGYLIHKTFPATDKIAVTDDAFLAGWMDEEGGGGGEEGGGDAPAPEAPGSEPNSVDDMVKRLEDYAAKEVERRLQERIRKQDTPAAPGPEQSSSLNETVMKQASGRHYQAALDAIARSLSSDAALVNAVAEFNAALNIQIPVGVYRAALTVGPTSAYKTAEEFRNACDEALGRRATLPEARTLIRIGTLLSRRSASGQTPVTGSRQGGTR